MLQATTKNNKRWGGRTFRFKLRSFLPGRNFYVRRFSITEAAFLLMMAYLTSKGLGAIRQALFNSLFGTGPAATAYYVAFLIPDTIFNLIAGGALVHAFVPVFLSYEKERGEAEVWRFTSLVFNVLLVAITALVLVAEFFAPQFVSNILAPGLTPHEQNLTATLTRIMLLQPLILGLGSIATGILHSKRQFLPSALSIAIYDFGLIGGILFARAVPGVGIYGPTFGLLVSAVGQVAVQIPGVIKLGARYTFTWNLKNPGLGQLMRLLGPNVLSSGVIFSGAIVITSFASYLPDKASIAALSNASLLFALPLTLIGVALANALLPQITSYATSGRYVRMSWTVMRFVGGATLLSIPVAMLLYFLGKPAIHILFQHGAFSQHASTLTNTALLGYAVGLPAQTSGLLIILAFYALKDAWTPLFMNALGLVAHIGLAVILLRVLKGDRAVLAITLAGSLAATAEVGLLSLILFVRLRAKVKNDKGMQRLLQRRMGRLVPSQQVIVGHPELVPVDPGALMNLVGQHISVMINPGAGSANPAIVLEMLTHILQRLRNQGQQSYLMVMHEYNRAAGVYPNNAYLQFVLGRLHQELGNYDRAIDTYMLAVQHNILEVMARIGAAQCLLLEGLPEAAIHQLEQGLQSVRHSSMTLITPRIWAARPREDGEAFQIPEAEISALLDRAYESRKRQQQMRTFLRQVKPGSPTSSSHLEVTPIPAHTEFSAAEENIAYNGGQSYGQSTYQDLTGFSTPDEHIDNTAMHEHSQNALHEILQLPPQESVPYDELADIYKIRGLLHETIAELCEQTVVYLSANQVEQAGATVRRIGSMYAELGDADEALTHLCRAIELMPGDVDLLREVVGFCLQLERRTDATRYQEKIARHYFDRRQATEAITALQQWINLDQHNYEPYDLLGRVYLSVGEYEQANRVYSYFATINPQFGTVSQAG